MQHAIRHYSNKNVIQKIKEIKGKKKFYLFSRVKKRETIFSIEWKFIRNLILRHYLNLNVFENERYRLYKELIDLLINKKHFLYFLE